MKSIVKLIEVISFVLITMIIGSMLNYFTYWFSTQHQLHTSAEDLTSYHNILILGAGRKNPVFYSRMQATLDLYHKLNVKKITCSGLTGVPNYSEPFDMQQYLIKNAVPAHLIELDTLGRHTYNSVINYAQKYHGDRVIIVSQAQHLGRALSIANCKGLHASGYVASGKNFKYSQRWFIYEYLARIKCSLLLLFY